MKSILLTEEWEAGNNKTIQQNKLTIAKKVIAFNKALSPPSNLPDGIEVLNPFINKDTLKYSEEFYEKYYADKSPRVALFGINPGRLGAGITGVPFTDPINLTAYCGIDNHLPQKKELSSQFIYQMIEEYGGVKAFYDRFLFTAISPLGFVKEGKNINYYDQKGLEKSLYPYILDCVKSHFDFGIKMHCICLGEGANFKFFQKLNKEYQFFKSITPLPHPRYILQYKRKELLRYIDQYIKTCDAVFLKA